MESLVRYFHLDVYKGLIILLVKHGHLELVSSLGLSKTISKQDVLEGKSAGHRAIEELPGDIQKLGPTFVKIGQMLAGRADLLPREYITALEHLQDSCEQMPFEQVREVIEAELDRPLDEAYAHFDRTPVGAASIGQVHRARLHDGRDVAVKVQRPDIRERMISDLQVVRQIGDMVTEHTEWGYRHQLSEIVAEFQHTLMRELDYEQEASNLTRLGENIAEFERVVVPQPVDELTTHRVLTMDFISGQKIKTLRDSKVPPANGLELADELFRAYLKQVLIDGFFHADPHPGNLMLTDDGKIALLDMGMVGKLAPRLRERILTLVMAAADGRSEDVTHVALEIGHPLESFNRRQFTQLINRTVMDRYKNTASGKAAGRLMLSIAEIAGETGVFMPTEIAVLGKALVNLESVGRVLAPEFDVDTTIRQSMSRLVNRRLLQSLAPGNLLSGALQTKELVNDLPRQVSTILNHLSRNETRIRVDALDEERLINGIRSIANRIAAGLVLASMLIAAAILMNVQTHYILFGYPALAIVLFLIAAAMGFVLIFTTWWSDHDMKFGRRRKK